MSGRNLLSCDNVGFNCVLKLPGPEFAVAYDDMPPRELAMTLTVAADMERPSLVRVGASSEPWSVKGTSACGFTERTGGVIQTIGLSTASHVGIVAPPSSCLMSRGGWEYQSACAAVPDRLLKWGCVAVAWEFEEGAAQHLGEARGGRQGSVKAFRAENECSQPVLMCSRVAVSIETPARMAHVSRQRRLRARASYSTPAADILVGICGVSDSLNTMLA